MLAPGPNADQGGPGRVGQDILGLLDVDDDLGAKRDRTPNDGDRRGQAIDRLERIAALDPRVVAAVEQADVVHSGVTQDHQRPGRGDLASPTAGPLLLGIALGVASVDHDRRVVRDAQRAKGGLDDLRRAAVPVDGILEPVGVEVERARDMALGVFLGDSEVDVEEQELLVGRGLRPPPVEDVPQPWDVDERLVLLELVERQRGSAAQAVAPPWYARAPSMPRSASAATNSAASSAPSP